LKYYIIAGEASGDLHGSNLMKAIYSLDPQADIRFWGGDRMKNVGGTSAKHIKDLAFMGFVEVVSNLSTILKNIKFCKTDILNFAPDKLILIDYPGFNLRIAEFAKKQQIPVHYYISPQIWAWKQNRVHKIKKIVDFMYCILPFEKEFYKRFDVTVNYVGHPLVDAIKDFKLNQSDKEAFRLKYELSDKKILALLPGSRLQEIRAKLPIMLKAAAHFSDFQILIAGAPNMEDKVYLDIAKNISIKIIQNETYPLLNNSFMAMVTSGTATLETALFKVPQVVCYKGNPISVLIARWLIKVKYISLVNLIMEKELVKELIQSDLTPKNIIRELTCFADTNKPERIDLVNQYHELETVLGGGGASEIVAQNIIKN
jgi:lipid-A-disaccharide synthase